MSFTDAELRLLKLSDANDHGAAGRPRVARPPPKDPHRPRLPAPDEKTARRRAQYRSSWHRSQRRKAAQRGEGVQLADFARVLAAIVSGIKLANPSDSRAEVDRRSLARGPASGGDGSAGLGASVLANDGDAHRVSP